MEHLGTEIIETPRCILRPFRIEDAEVMYRNWASDSEVTKYLTWPIHESPEVTRELLALWISQYNNAEYYQWAIELKALGEVIGSISIVELDNKTCSAEVGYCIGRPWWGQGLTPEVLRALIDFLFNHVGFNRVAARHDVNNPKSGRVMQKAGMSYEGTLRASAINNQGIVDIAVYSILMDEFLS